MPQAGPSVTHEAGTEDAADAWSTPDSKPLPACARGGVAAPRLAEDVALLCARERKTAGVSVRARDRQTHRRIPAIVLFVGRGATNALASQQLPKHSSKQPAAHGGTRRRTAAAHGGTRHHMASHSGAQRRTASHSGAAVHSSTQRHTASLNGAKRRTAAHSGTRHHTAAPSGAQWCTAAHSRTNRRTSEQQNKAAHSRTSAWQARQMQGNGHLNKDVPWDAMAHHGAPEVRPRGRLQGTACIEAHGAMLHAASHLADVFDGSGCNGCMQRSAEEPSESSLMTTCCLGLGLGLGLCPGACADLRADPMRISLHMPGNGAWHKGCNCHAPCMPCTWAWARVTVF
jgi:hypothetical protein